MPGPVVLTYHSISQTPGPTSIPVATFRMQMETLAAEGYGSMTLQDFLDWRGGAAAERRALITFDDAFLDFREAAQPILRRHNFTSVVFVPTRRLGGAEAWDGADTPARPLMSWDQVEALAEDGVEFGSHSLSHADLTAVSSPVRHDEIEQSGAELAHHLDRPTRSFAAPYGRVNAAVLADLRGRYELAFGTRFARPRRSDDAVDVPRIEMHYFREAARWRDFLRGRDGYFQARRALRGARETLARLGVGG